MFKATAFLLVLAGWVLYAEPTLARAELSTSYRQDMGSAKLTLSSSICADNPECTVATLTCGHYNSISLMMGGFSNDDVGRWLLLNGLLLTLKNGANALPMMPVLIEFGDLDSDWSITFVASGNAQMWLRALDFDKDIVVNNIQDDLLLPRKDEDLLNLKSFAKFCSETVH